jgi:hypothetical protein
LIIRAVDPLELQFITVLFVTARAWHTGGDYERAAICAARWRVRAQFSAVCQVGHQRGEQAPALRLGNGKSIFLMFNKHK